MKRLFIIAAVAILCGCSSFKANQFGACIVTGGGQCLLKTNGQEAK